MSTEIIHPSLFIIHYYEVMTLQGNQLMELSMNFSLLILQAAKFLRLQKQFVLSDQLLKSGTSVGANICEAQFAQSRADFISKMQIALKEASEADYWIELLRRSDDLPEDICADLKDSSNHLLPCLVATVKTAKANLQKHTENNT